MKFSRWLAVGFLLFFMAGAHAQGSPTVQIGPLTAYCRDPYGITVVNYFRPTSMGAMASVVRGGPAITVDPGFAASVGWAFNVFTYVHECGHHFLGHILGAPVSMWDRELAADCYAAKMTRNLGWLSDGDFAIAMNRLATFRGSATHPPGPARVANAQACRAIP